MAIEAKFTFLTHQKHEQKSFATDVHLLEFIKKNHHQLQVVDLSHAIVSHHCIGGILDVLKNSRGLRKLNLWDVKTDQHSKLRLDESDAKIIASLLAKNKSLQTLDLTGATINGIGLELIFQTLASNQSLETLFVRDVGATKQAVETLGESLKKNQTLLKLDLACNKQIDDGSADVIASALSQNKAIQNLCLSQCTISDVGANSLLKEITKPSSSVVNLDLSGNKKISQSTHSAITQATAEKKQNLIESRSDSQSSNPSFSSNLPEDNQFNNSKEFIRVVKKPVGGGFRGFVTAPLPRGIVQKAANPSTDVSGLEIVGVGLKSSLHEKAR